MTGPFIGPIAKQLNASALYSSAKLFSIIPVTSLDQEEALPLTISLIDPGAFAIITLPANAPK
jgi:hypothetical protein